LSLTNLFRYLDSIEIGFTGYLLHNPHHLAVGALPSSIRRLAATRLRDYAGDDCRTEHRPLVLSLAAEFEAGDDQVNPGVLRDFMLFTNDMDTSRGQSIHQTDPELVALLEQTGFPWLDETLHASADPSAERVHRRRYPPVQAQNEASRLHRDLSVAIKSLHDQLAQSRVETAQTGDERGRMRDKLKQAHDEGEHTRDELERVREEVKQARDALKQARTDLTRTRGDLAMAEEKAARASSELTQVYASRSWRATRPLRSAGRMLRR